jgi:hypothetical protein
MVHTALLGLGTFMLKTVPLIKQILYFSIHIFHFLFIAHHKQAGLADSMVRRPYHSMPGVLIIKHI